MTSPTTTATPNLEELEAILHDQTQVMTLLKEGRFGAFIKNYAEAKAEKHREVIAQVREEVQASLQEWIRDSGGQLRRLNMDPDHGVRDMVARKGTVYNKAAPGAQIDQSKAKPEDLTEFLRAIWHHSNQLPNYDDLRSKVNEWKRIQNSFGSTVPSDGGFLIPETLRSEILQLAIEASIVRGRAQVIPMSSLAVPIPTVDETSRVSSVFGGMVAYWTEEGAEAQVSKAKFGRVRLEAKKLTIYTEAPDELIADAPAFGGFLSVNMPRASAFHEDVAFINGSGVGEPLGVLNPRNKGLITPTREATGRVTFVDVVNLFTRLLPGSYENAVWLCSPAVVAQLLQLVLSVNGTGVASPPLWLTGGQAIERAPLQLLGRPLIVSEKVPHLGSIGDLSLVDFSHYLIGDRQIMQASSSPHFKFSSDVTAYKVVERVDGQPWVRSPLTPHNNGDTLSPYVALSDQQTA